MRIFNCKICNKEVKVHNNRPRAKYCSFNCRNADYQGVCFSPSTKFKKGQIFTEERNKKVSESNKGRVSPRKGLKKKYKIICKLCKEEFITLKQSRKICDKEDCQSKKNILHKFKHSEEAKRKISLALKGKIPKNLLVRIKATNCFKQYDMFLIIKKYFSDATPNYFIQTKKTKRWLDVAIPSLFIDFEYDGKVHLMKNIQIKDKARDIELSEINWKTIRINRNNFHQLEDILKSLKNGDVYNV